jgi:FkbM family methyltransferase
VSNLRELVSRAAVAVLGRRQVARFGQSLSDWARLDVPNKMGRNGETLVQAMVLARSGETNPVFFDVGANVGDWTLALLTQWRRSKVPKIRVHDFEPCESTRKLLIERIDREDRDAAVTIVPVALSDRSGHSTFYVIGAGAGRNSLYPVGGSTTQEVETVTLDDYCRSASIDRIALLKIDTEGHDMLVMQGARSLLADRRVSVVQFEYNYLWVNARHYLKDVFDFASPLGYTVAKITPAGVEPYAKWHHELETFREANYILAHDEAMSWFPSVRWWNA